MNDVFDKILASRPVNSQTAKAMSGGAVYDPKIKTAARSYSDVLVHSDLPSKCLPIPTDALTLRTFINLTGWKFGKMTVVGYLGKLNPKNDKKASWLVRCVCGNYETRKTVSVKRKDPTDCCLKCRAWETAKRRYEKRGPNQISTFIPTNQEPSK